MEMDVTELKSQIVVSPGRSKSIQRNAMHLYEIIAKEKNHSNPSYKTYNLWPNSVKDVGTASLVLLGETGKGKTSLINGLLNVLLRIDFQHVFRILVPIQDETPNKSDTDSQTEKITVYNIPYVDGMPYRCNFKLIDTPGMLDTRGNGIHKKHLQRIKKFIQKYSYKDNLSIGIVTESHLSPSNKVNALVEDLKTIVNKHPNVKVISIATFADIKEPTCHAVLEKLNIKLDKTIRINNSTLFRNSFNSSSRLLEKNWEKWEQQSLALLEYIRQQTLMASTLDKLRNASISYTSSTLEYESPRAPPLTYRSSISGTSAGTVSSFGSYSSTISTMKHESSISNTAHLQRLYDKMVEELREATKQVETERMSKAEIEKELRESEKQVKTERKRKAEIEKELQDLKKQRIDERNSEDVTQSK